MWTQFREDCDGKAVISVDTMLHREDCDCKAVTSVNAIVHREDCDCGDKVVISVVTSCYIGL